MTKITNAGAAMTHQDISPRALPKETLQAVSKAQHTVMRRMETTPFILDFLNIRSTPFCVILGISCSHRNVFLVFVFYFRYADDQIFSVRVTCAVNAEQSVFRILCKFEGGAVIGPPYVFYFAERIFEGARPLAGYADDDVFLCLHGQVVDIQIAFLIFIQHKIFSA